MGTAKRLGVHGLIKNTLGLYLVMKRSELDEDEGNCWDPVGGGIEESETVEVGFKREVMEEAGIEVTEAKVLLAYTLEEKGLQLIMSAQTDENEIKLSPEHNGYKWIPYQELLTIQPVSMHLKAIQYMLKNNLEAVRYEEYK
jgi:8-oxo-dGTP pyrophosphatase MutT (NUDIX family)